MLSAREAVRRLRLKGYRWISLEWNEPDYQNWTRGPEFRQACADEGVVFTIWMTRNFTAAEARQAVLESGAAGFLAEGEIPGHRPEAQNWAELDLALKDISIPKGVITNFAPFVDPNGVPTHEKARPLVENGWACITECYDMSGDPKEWIDRRHAFAQHFTHESAPHIFSQGKGWYETQPAIGLYGGLTWADFPQFPNYRNGSVWAAEYVI